MSLKAHVTRTGNPLLQIQVPGDTVEAFEAAVSARGPALFRAIRRAASGQSLTPAETGAADTMGTMPSLIVQCSHPEGMIALDGIVRGRTPQAMVSTVGPHEVVCTVDGARTHRRIELVEGARAEIALTITEDQLAVARAARMTEARSTARTLSYVCLLYTSPSPRDQRGSRMPSSA